MRWLQGRNSIMQKLSSSSIRIPVKLSRISLALLWGFLPRGGMRSI